MDITFREVLSQMSQADLVRLLPWLLSATAKSRAGPKCSMSEAFTSIITSELGCTTAPALMSSPASSINTLPPVLAALDILAASTPVVQPFFTLTLGLKHKKLDCSLGSTSEGQSSKSVHAGTEEGSISSGCSTLPIHLVGSHSPKQLGPELIILPSSPVKDPDVRLADMIETLW